MTNHLGQLIMNRNFSRLLLRGYPFYSGYWKVLSSRLVSLLETRAAPGKIVTTRIRGGLLMDVRLDDTEGRCIDLLGEWDPRISWICRKVLRPGDTFVDIGANFGLVSLVGAKAVGPTGCAHAFEPQADLGRMLRKSAAMNGLDWLTVHGIALSDEDGTKMLLVPEGHSGTASLVSEKEASDPAETGQNVFPVEVRKGRDYFRSQDIGPVRMMKIDVEGHEYSVLKGLEEEFLENPPAAVVFESNGWFEGLARGKKSTDYEFANNPTVRFFIEHEYRIFAISRSYFRVRLLEIDHGTNKHPPVSDLLAIHKSHVDELTPSLGLSRARS